MVRKGGAGANRGAAAASRKAATKPRNSEAKLLCPSPTGNQERPTDGSQERPTNGRGGYASKSTSKVIDYVEVECAQSVSNAKISVGAARKKQKLEEPKVWTSHYSFTGFVSLAIVANAFVLGFEQDYEKDSKTVFLILNHTFTGIFFIELICRQIAEGPKKYFADSANILDFVLVVLSVFEMWIVPAVGMDTSMDTRSMSVLRILRLLRLVRILRVFKIFKELTIMVDGMSKTKAIIFWGSIFLLVIVYMFAMTASMMFGNAYECPEEHPASEEQSCPAYYQFEEFTQEELFGTLANSMATLYMCMFEGCGFDIIRPMILKAPLVMVFWYLFIFLTSFGILNVILGLFCETVITSALEQEKNLRALEEDTRQENFRQLKTLWESMDKDGSGEITGDEFHAAVTSDPEVMFLIEAMGLEEEDDLFEVLDFNKTNSLSHYEFFQGMMLLINGSRPMTTKDNVSTFLTCQSNHNLLHSMLKLVQDSKVLGDLTVVKEGLRTHILLPGQQTTTPRHRDAGMLDSNPQCPADSSKEANSCNQEDKDVPILELNSQNGHASSSMEPLKEVGMQEAMVHDLSTQDTVDTLTPQPVAEVDLTSESFTLPGSFAALQARVSQMDHKVESRLGSVENQLKMQQQEFNNISRKMDSIAHVLEHIMIQQSQQRQPQVPLLE
jgi:voltage-gated sodium channel